MKKHFITVTLFLLVASAFNAVYGQDTLNYSQLESAHKISFGKEMKKYDVYVTKDGQMFKIGDTITIGKPSLGSVFNYVFHAEGGPLSDKVTKLDAQYAGTKTKIYRVDIRGNKRMGYFAVLKTQSAEGGRFFGSYFIEIENAIQAGELVTSALTSDEALNELEKYKKELDLGLIKQDEYDQKKAELTKYIH